MQDIKNVGSNPGMPWILHTSARRLKVKPVATSM
jgi:hypothetical protein